MPMTITRRANWDLMRNFHPGILMGWMPGSGFLNYGQWVGYNEAMIMYILAMGSPTYPVDSVGWSTWTQGYSWQIALRPDVRHLPAALRPPVLALLDRFPEHPGRVHAGKRDHVL